MKAEAIVMEEFALGQFLRHRREQLGYGLREMCRMTLKNPDCGQPLSEKGGYYSRVENGRVNEEKISMDFF